MAHQATEPSSACFCSALALLTGTSLHVHTHTHTYVYTHTRKGHSTARAGSQWWPALSRITLLFLVLPLGSSSQLATGKWREMVLSSSFLVATALRHRYTRSKHVVLSSVYPSELCRGSSRMWPPGDQGSKFFWSLSWISEVTAWGPLPGLSLQTRDHQGLLHAGDCSPSSTCHIHTVTTQHPYIPREPGCRQGPVLRIQR